MTDARYVQWENLNEYRNYPFAEHATMSDSSGNDLAADVFSDAILNPIVHEDAPVFLTSISHGAVVVSCGDVSITGEGTEESDTIQLADQYGRCAGVLVCGSGWKREFLSSKERTLNAEFSAFVSCPVVYNWVEGFVHDSFRSSRRNVTFSGDGVIVPHLDQTRNGVALSFDAFYDPGTTATDGAIRQILFASVGQTVFEVVQPASEDESESSNVIVWTPQLDRDDICWQAHREDSVAEVVDTCPGPSPTPPVCPPEPVPYVKNEVYVCPTETGSINLVADDFLNYKNPLKVETYEGSVSPNTPVVRGNMTQDDLMREGERLLDRPVRVGNGLKISIPGLGNVF